MARSKGQRGYEIQLAFCVAGIQLLKYPKRRCLRMDSANHRRKTSLFFCSAKPSKRCHDIATCIGLVRLAPPAEEQSGDRQRREKARPFGRRKKASTSALQKLVNAIQLHCARHCKPRRQNGQSKPFSRRVSAADCPEGKRGPSGALGAAQSDPQGGWEASRATGRELCDTGHPVLVDSP